MSFVMVKQVNSLRSFLRFTNWMSQPGYRSKQEEVQWKERDPLENVLGKLKQRSLLTDEQADELRAAAERTVQEAMEFCTDTNGSGKATSVWSGSKQENSFGKDSGVLVYLSQFQFLFSTEPVSPP